MKLVIRKSMLPGIFLTLAMSGPVWAQSASTQMKEAGSSAENAVSHAYHGTVTAADDTALTAKVKTALHDDAATKDSTIHVATVAGVVTLRGKVASGTISDRAQAITQSTTGVKGVKNKLKFPQT
jgi:hyperosmotically inducible periplasmic protein